MPRATDRGCRRSREATGAGRPHGRVDNGARFRETVPPDIPTRRHEVKPAASGRHPRIRLVVESDLCIACGVCIPTCPEGVVAPAYDRGRGTHEVAVVDSAPCPECPAPCDEVCPSVAVDFSALSDGAIEGDLGRIGPLRSVWTGYAPSHRDNGISSSGGLIRALVHHALSQGTPVVCLAKRDGKFGDPDASYGAVRLRSIDDLERMPGSIYHSVAFTDAIDDLERHPEPAVLVALPCHLEGIEKYLRLRAPHLRSRIALRVGLICGWMYSDHSLAAFAAFRDVPGKVKDAAYRGGSKVGDLQLWTTRGHYRFSRRKFDARSDRIAYQASFSRYLNRLRCRVCEDHLNVLADVVVGDAWLRSARDQKASVLAVRSARGDAWIQDRVSAGDLVLRRGSVADLVESQSSDLCFGTSAREMRAFLADLGSFTPEFEFGDQRRVTSADARQEYSFEMLMRRLVRAGRYDAFRALYAMRDRANGARAKLRRRLAALTRPR